MGPKKRFIVASEPAINLKNEMNAIISILDKQRGQTSLELDETFVTTTEVQDIKNVDDEFTREQVFSEQAKLAAGEMIPKLKQLGIPVEVPDTFKGERMKDEQHMAKVRDTLKAKKDTIEKSQRVRKLRELKKMGKKIQTEVLKKRAKEKKEFLEKVKRKPVSELFDD